jgi:hypothetical protein
MTIRIPPYPPGSQKPSFTVEPLVSGDKSRDKEKTPDKVPNTIDSMRLSPLAQQKAPDVKDSGSIPQPQKMETIEMPGIRERVPEPKNSFVQSVIDFFKRLFSDS